MARNLLVPWSWTFCPPEVRGMDFSCYKATSMIFSYSSPKGLRQVSYQICYLHFLPFCKLSFCFLNCVLWDTQKKVFNFKKSNLSVLFFCCLCFCYPKKPSKVTILTLMFCSKRFIVLAVTVLHQLIYHFLPFILIMCHIILILICWTTLTKLRWIPLSHGM